MLMKGQEKLDVIGCHIAATLGYCLTLDTARANARFLVCIYMCTVYSLASRGNIVNMYVHVYVYTYICLL